MSWSGWTGWWLDRVSGSRRASDTPPSPALHHRREGISPSLYLGGGRGEGRRGEETRGCSLYSEGREEGGGRTELCRGRARAEITNLYLFTETRRDMRDVVKASACFTYLAQ